MGIFSTSYPLIWGSSTPIHVSSFTAGAHWTFEKRVANMSVTQSCISLGYRQLLS